MCAEPFEAGAEKCPSCGESLVRRSAPPKDGLSTFAIVVLCGLVLCVVSSVIAAIAIPGVVQPRRTGNEYAAIGALKTINTAQTLFRESDKEADGTLDYGSLTELSDVTYIDAILGGGQKQGYLFQAAPSPTTPEFLWMAVANPAVPGTTGDRYFVTNQAGIIYYSTTTPFVLTPDCAIPAHAVPLGR
jgi:hypothetical protein